MSDQDENIFENKEVKTETSAAEEQSKETSVENQYQDILKEITDNDGRQKYDSIDKALQALPHANQHISQLEAELKEMREELQKRATAEELLSKVQEGNGKQTSSPTLDQNQLTELVESVLSNKEAQKTAQENLKSVNDAMVSYYGDLEKAKEVYSIRAAELGLDLQELSARSPKAALKLLGIGETTSKVTPKSTGSVNTEAFGGTPRVETPKTVMGASSTKDAVNFWRACAPSQEN